MHFEKIGLELGRFAGLFSKGETGRSVIGMCTGKKLRFLLYRCRKIYFFYNRM